MAWQATNSPMAGLCAGCDDALGERPVPDSNGPVASKIAPPTPRRAGINPLKVTLWYGLDPPHAQQQRWPQRRRLGNNVHHPSWPYSW